MTDEDVPPAAQLIRDFVNTREPQTGREELRGPRDLGTWLGARGLTGAGIGDDDLAVALRLREGLRAVLLTHAGHDADPSAIAALDAALSRVPVRLHLGPDGARLLPAGGSAQALAPLVEAVRACGQDQSWRRLKACSRDTCHWAYYDSSRNQSRRWCSMAGCGNYVKMRRRNGSRD
ncbi:CGNR zinc finger domain-containing protein [Kineococcus sp. SYSU DK003]|uniref:CGNR zinc finger domain-containing protein n=1 Tax=Kineococcus sp. SYSU DK003 TaxID=3383124 RepID=UPI003D7CEA3C